MPSRPKRLRRLLGAAVVLPFLLATGLQIEAMRFAGRARRILKENDVEDDVREDVREAIEHVRYDVAYPKHGSRVSPEDAEFLCDTVEAQAVALAHNHDYTRGLLQTAGPRYLIRDGQSIDEVHTAGLLELLLKQTRATLDDLRVIAALGIGGCHDVETDSGAVVRIERVES